MISKHAHTLVMASPLSDPAASIPCAAKDEGEAAHRLKQLPL